MHKTLFISLILLTFASAKAQQAAVIKSGSEVIGLNETAWNFGKIPQGRPVTHVFMVTNTGTETLSLENVQASCGCTTPEWDHKPIAPGAKSEIRVGYNAQAEGAFEKTISIFYNKGQLKTLTIRGEVWRTPDQSAPKNASTALLKNIN
jgi:hypothetical protein